MATSQTVGTVVFQVQQVIDRAYGRCKIKPQLISGEMGKIAQDCMFLVMSEMIANKLLLWTIQRTIYPMYQGVNSIPLNSGQVTGVVDVYDVNYRSLLRQTSGGTASATAGVATNAFDNNFATSCTQVAPAGSITYQFVSATIIDTVGILANATDATASYICQGSNDGVTWTTVYSSPVYTQTAGTWNWFDVSIHYPYLYFRVVADATTIIDFRELFFGNIGIEVPMYRMNRNDYESLPNKYMQSRPLQFWVDRQYVGGPAMILWPIPSASEVYSSVTARYTRYIQDVGALTNQLEIPSYWLNAFITKLAYAVAREMPAAQMPPQLLMILKQEAMADVEVPMNEEIDRGPINIRPYIIPYTR